MSDTPLSRGKFLKSLGSSVTGMALGKGIAVAQAIVTRIAAVAREPGDFSEAKSATIGEAPFIHAGPGEGNRIALTFDDGPAPGTTERILDELKQRNIPATFFMIGERVAAAPELARRVKAEGHEIANHSYTHPKLNTFADAQVTAELRKTQDVFTAELNQQAACFRPPYGAFRKNQGGLAQKEGLRVILWSVDPADWSLPGEDVVIERILSQTKPGSIILCHDLPQTANCIGRILEALLERGLQFVTVSSLIGSAAK